MSPSLIDLLVLSHGKSRIAILAGIALVPLLFLIGAGCSGLQRVAGNWWELRRDSSGQAPDPATTPRGGHPGVRRAGGRLARRASPFTRWIAMKPSGAAVLHPLRGDGLGRGPRRAAIRVNRTGPDDYWFGAPARPPARSPRRRRRRADRPGRGGRQSLPVSGQLPHVAGPQQQHVHRVRRAQPCPS